MSTVIGADRARVWRALTEAAEVVRWDERVIALEEPAGEYPQVGRKVRWRYRLGAIPVVLHECPLEVIPDARLRSIRGARALPISTRPSSSRSEPGDGERTRLTLKLVASNSIPVVGGVLDRFAVRRLANEFIDAKLRAVQKWCESPAPAKTSFAVSGERTGGLCARMPGAWLAAVALLAACAAPRAAGPVPAPQLQIDSARIARDVAWLADDAREGRGVGTPGIAAAAGF